ncbi:FIST C-terminal domain-containing protein [Niveibacterium sp. 24ML]|uniref:FIST signal transduction protein n=1 Tax=Niveibacterium sp. 24ML TaxID=2985512 RepID=UPI00226D96E2|nr:FIST N-terminal domain-containing protein [Niveibacterium sp. 24ML]MCX9155941.1 FIST C-terminal domain-containing protein [Niveibacterium sp. 24ML]
MSLPASRFASGFALAVDWRVALDTALERLALPAGANLGFCYWSDRFNGEIDTIISALRERTGVEHWVGASAIGVVGREGAQLDAPGISLLIAALPEGSFRTFSGRSPLPHQREFDAHSAVVHADPATPDMPDLVRDMASKLSGLHLCGGMASGRDGTMLLADAPFAGGICGVAFDPRIVLQGELTQGCRQLGPPRVASEVEDNLIGRLDGRRAVAVFRDTASPLYRDDLRRAARGIHLALADEEDPSHYTVRHVIGIDPNGGRLAIDDQPDEGQQVFFVRRDAETAAHDLDAMLLRLRSRCPAEPKALLYVSCTGRGGALFERDDSEIEAIQRVFGQIPLAGFFASGELLGARLYGYTGVLTVFC